MEPEGFTILMSALDGVVRKKGEKESLKPKLPLSPRKILSLDPPILNPYRPPVEKMLNHYWINVLSSLIPLYAFFVVMVRCPFFHSLPELLTRT